MRVGAYPDTLPGLHSDVSMRQLSADEEEHVAKSSCNNGPFSRELLQICSLNC